MKLDDVTSQEIETLRDAYTRELRHEKQASASVRRQWKIVFLALDAELARRFNGGARAVLEASRPK